MDTHESIQKLADSRLAEPYRQPVKTLDDCLSALDWPLDDSNRPICCGESIDVDTFIGAPYRTVCPKCSKFLFHVFAPEFGNSWVQTIDTDKFDMQDKRQWVCGNAEGAL